MMMNNSNINYRNNQSARLQMERWEVQEVKKKINKYLGK